MTTTEKERSGNCEVTGLDREICDHCVECGAANEDECGCGEYVRHSAEEEWSHHQ